MNTMILALAAASLAAASSVPVAPVYNNVGKVQLILDVSDV